MVGESEGHRSTHNKRPWRKAQIILIVRSWSNVSLPGSIAVLPKLRTWGFSEGLSLEVVCIIWMLRPHFITLFRRGTRPNGINHEILQSHCQPSHIPVKASKYHLDFWRTVWRRGRGRDQMTDDRRSDALLIKPTSCARQNDLNFRKKLLRARHVRSIFAPFRGFRARDGQTRKWMNASPPDPSSNFKS